MDGRDAGSAAVARRLGAIPDRSIRAPGLEGATLWRHRPAETLGAAPGRFPDLGAGAWLDGGRIAA